MAASPDQALAPASPRREIHASERALKGKVHWSSMPSGAPSRSNTGSRIPPKPASRSHAMRVSVSLSPKGGGCRPESITVPTSRSTPLAARTASAARLGRNFKGRCPGWG